MATKQTNRPDYGVFVVEGEGKTAFWTKIGAAWKHEDGKGFSISLTALPLTGRLTLRSKPEETEGEEEGR